MTTLIHEEKLAGIVERVTFHSAETGWSILKVSPYNTPKAMVTVVIHQAKVFAGASMDFYGGWVTHPKFGEQFKAERAIEKKPASSAALEKYLGSGLIKGVGPKTAKKIVKHFGDRTLEVFESKIEELLNVPTIANKKLVQIKNSWDEHKSIRDVMMFLQSHGVSTLFAVKVFKAYGNEAIKIVSENPYRLARDIYGIGFFSADAIALKMGFDRDGVPRVQSGIKHVLDQSRDDGHCYLTSDQILSKTGELLQLQNDELVLNSLNTLFEENEIKKRAITEDGRSFECFYAKTLYWDERYVAKKSIELLGGFICTDDTRIDDWISKYCQQNDITLSDEQSESVSTIVRRPFSILTGGPGCGKTTTTKVLVKLLQAMRKRITLAAPTGRAAQRMSEVIGMEAKTIHRLLEFGPQKGGFKKGEDDKLVTDFLIIDECSMLDINLAASLLKAIGNTTQVLLIGDPDQLPSVGAGAVLHDMLDSGRIPHFRLTQIFRQAQASSIIKFAHQINKGETPQILSPMAVKDLWAKDIDCMFIDSEEVTREQASFIMRSKQVISKAIDYQEMHYVQVDNKLVGKIHEVDGHVEIDHLFCPDIDDENINAPIFNIPRKFSHVDLAKLANSKNEIEELKSVLKKVHPWSSLNYGLTALETIRRIYTKTIKEKLGVNCEIQILTPQVRGTLGTANLNTTIQETVNPQRPGSVQVRIGDRILREGDRIIQTRNNYDLNVFNGDIGVITSIDAEDYSCLINFGGNDKMVTYQKEDLTEISLAYAITIHKSQGSEFEAVIIPVTTQHYKMLFRNLIYTGLTRGRKLAILVGSRKALAMAVRSLDSRKRQTALKYLLQTDSCQ